MVCVDTSVWVAALRDETGPEALALERLLDDDAVAMPAPVRAELLSAMPVGDFVRYRRLFSALPMWFPTKETWIRMEVWLEYAVQKGERFGMADLLIASISVEKRARLWSLDRDFSRMSKLRLIEVYEPR